VIRYLIRRLLELLPALFAIVTITFFLIRMAPGGPFDRERNVAPEVRAALEAHYHLDDPLWRQYVDYLGGLLHGDLGLSFSKPGYTVTELIAMRLPVSLELGLYGLLIALFIGMGAGLLAALKPNSLIDYGPMTLAMIGICVPSFVLGPILLLIFAEQLHWFPVLGWESPADKVLPSLTLGAVYAAYIARLTRGGMLEVMSQDYIRTARAKGLPEHTVVLRHGLRGGVQPVVAFLGPAIARLMTGSFVVETIFWIPGLGRDFVKAAFNRDYTLIMGAVLVYAVFVLVLNLLADIAQAWLDPRIRER
jgi:oligopeptide transport system permease protein